MARKTLVKAGKSVSAKKATRKRPRGKKAAGTPKQGVERPPKQRVERPAERPMGHLVVERVPIAKLKPATYNPRRDLQPGDPEYEKILRSVEHFGYVDGIVWNKRSGNIVGGHQRLKILRDHFGVDEVDVSVVDLDDTQERQLNVALNKLAGDWDEDALSLVMADLARREDADATLTGFEDAEIELMLDGDGDGAAGPDLEHVAVEGSYKVMATCRNKAEQDRVMTLLGRQKVACHTITRG